MFEILQALRYSELNQTQEQILVSLGKVWFLHTQRITFSSGLTKRPVVCLLSENYLKNVALIN